MKTKRVMIFKLGNHSVYRTILEKFVAFCNFACLFEFNLHILLCLIIFPIFTAYLSSSNVYLKFVYLYLALIY